MHPLEHGGHSHGGMMGGPHGMGHNTVPTGQRNLFMFSMVNGQQRDHGRLGTLGLRLRTRKGPR